MICPNCEYEPMDYEASGSGGEWHCPACDTYHEDYGAGGYGDAEDYQHALAEELDGMTETERQRFLLGGWSPTIPNPDAFALLAREVEKSASVLADSLLSTLQSSAPSLFRLLEHVNEQARLNQERQENHLRRVYLAKRHTKAIHNFRQAWREARQGQGIPLMELWLTLDEPERQTYIWYDRAGNARKSVFKGSRDR